MFSCASAHPKRTSVYGLGRGPELFSKNITVWKKKKPVIYSDVQGGAYVPRFAVWKEKWEEL